MIASDSYGPLEGYDYLYDIPSSANQFGRYAPAVKFDGAELVKGVVESTISYEDFLGEWQVGGSIWTVSEKVAGSTYNVTGLAGLSSIYSGADTVEGVFDAESGKFYILEQYLGEFNSDEVSAFASNPYGMCSDYLSGQFVYSSTAYNAYPLNTTTPAKVFLGTYDAETETVSLVPGTCNYGTFTAIAFSWVIQSGDNAGKGNKYGTVTALPATLSRAEKENSPVVKAAYEDFLGTWNSTDGSVLTITVAEEGSTYNVTGIPGSNNYEPFVAVFENGEMVISEQGLSSWESGNYGACMDVLSGVFEDGGEYRYYPFNGSVPQKICAAQMHQSGNVTFEAGACQYGAYVGFSYAWVITNTENANVGKGNWEDIFYLNTILKPAAAAAPAKASAKVKHNDKAQANMFVVRAVDTRSNLPSLVKTQVQRSAAPKTQATEARVNGIAAARLAK